MKTRIIICGGRHFEDYNTLEYFVDSIISKKKLRYEDIEIVSGNAQGADLLGERYAKERNIDVKIFKADWASYGRSAGPIRNRQMIDYIEGVQDKFVIAFASINSKGTLNTINIANKRGIECFVFEYDLDEEIYSELNEGIYYNDNDELVFDWSHDDSDDIIKLTQTKVSRTKLNSCDYYFCYKVNKGSNKTKRNNALNYIKSSNDSNVKKMIDTSLDMFYMNSDVKDFDHILVLPSNSSINNEIADTIKLKFDSNVNIIHVSKLPSSKLQLDINAIENSFKYDDLSKVYNYLNKIKYYVQEEDYFRISKIPPQYRKFFMPMIKFDKSFIDNSVDTNILIIDDIKTTGSSIMLVVNELKKLNFQGSITIFTLIRN